MSTTALGERIKVARNQSGMTQGQLASLLNVTSQAVSKWERGENAPDLFTMPALATALTSSIDRLMGHEQVNLDLATGTIVVTDIPGYTSRSDHLSPADLASMLNGQFFTQTQCVVQRGGLPIKYIGDAFLSVFVAEDHSDKAIEAALAMKRTSDSAMSIGIVSGSFYLGPIGHPDYARLDAIGNAINLAFRVEMWAGKNTRSGIAATDETVTSASGRVAAGEPAKIELKGIKDSCLVREILVE